MREGSVYTDPTLPYSQVEKLFPIDPPYLQKQFSSSIHKKKVPET